MSVDLHLNHLRQQVEPGRSLFDYAEVLGIPIPTSCHKQGKCKECLVEVVEGMDKLSAPHPAEAHLTDGFRLSCCCRVVGESGAVRCHTLKRGTMRVERQGLQLPRTAQGKLDPAVRRQQGRVCLDGIEIDRTEGPLHGLAMDLGTTTVVLRLLDLETGEVVADASFENPQRFGGSDIMARIRYDSECGGRLLQRTLMGYLAQVIREFPVAPESIYEMVVAGNSTMRDLFFGLDVTSIGQSPYQSITEQEVASGLRSTTSLAQPAARLKLPLHPRARVYGLPIISGHVGADAAACLLAIGLAQENGLVALMDIGTNTELLLGNKHRILAASCPAGPAFEGGRIACGMPGLPGAIERVKINCQDGFDYQVIGGAPPEGLCGSGLVDLLGELSRAGRINPLGRFEDGNNRVTITGVGENPIYLSEADINELAQAKGANAAGLQIIFDEYGAGFDQLDKFYIAGGFGRHIDLDAARRIGLIPNLPDEKIVQAGNAAIEGATIALLSMTRRAELEALVREVQHCRLEAHSGFFDYFVEGCQFQWLNITKPQAVP